MNREDICGVIGSLLKYQLMQKIKLIRIALFLFGAIAIIIGVALLLTPVAFQSSSGITLGENISLLSEMRAYGGIILSVGVVTMLGVFSNRFLFLSIGVSSIFYLAIGLSRLLSMLIDGMPAEALIFATVLELVIGSICLFLFLRSESFKYAVAESMS